MSKNRNWVVAVAMGALMMNGCGDAKEAAAVTTEIASEAPASEPLANQKSKAEYIKLIRENLESCVHFLSEDPYDRERAQSLYKNAEINCSLAKGNADKLVLSDPSSKATVGGLYKEYLGTSVENSLRNIKEARAYWESPEAEKAERNEELANDYFQANSICRGTADGAFSETEVNQNCDKRDKISIQLKKSGMCFDSAEQEWIICKK